MVVTGVRRMKPINLVADDTETPSKGRKASLVFWYGREARNYGKNDDR